MQQFKLFSFEGNEGTGKSTLSKAFAKEIGAFWTYEPNGETPDLKYLRSLALSQKALPKEAREQMLMANRCIHHTEIVKPLILAKSTVVTDRSFLSGMVYARLEKALSFDEWKHLAKLGGVNLFPDVIIFVKNNNRKIAKEIDNRYDHADDETLSQIDIEYDNALKFIRGDSLFKHIPIITFINDFNNSVDKNVGRLLKTLRESLL